MTTAYLMTLSEHGHWFRFIILRGSLFIIIDVFWVHISAMMDVGWMVCFLNMSYMIACSTGAFEEEMTPLFLCIQSRNVIKPSTVMYVLLRNSSIHKAFYVRINRCRGQFWWWRHQMETFSALLAICAGNSPVTGEFLAQRPVTRSIDISLICARINDWVNNREAGDLRRHRAHNDVTVMFQCECIITWKHVPITDGFHTKTTVKLNTNKLLNKHSSRR